jgi:hypothetical protein
LKLAAVAVREVLQSLSGLAILTNGRLGGKDMHVLHNPLAKEDWLQKVGERNGVSVPAAKRAVEKPRADAGPWEPAVEEIVSYQHLGDNWDGYGAEPPSCEVLESAIGLAYTYSQSGVDPPHRVAPGVTGSVIFEWQDPDGTYATVEIDAPLHAEVMVLQPGKPAQHWTLPTE